jgi:Mg-chelatase subunit ChlD
MIASIVLGLSCESAVEALVHGVHRLLGRKVLMRASSTGLKSATFALAVATSAVMALAACSGGSSGAARSEFSSDGTTSIGGSAGSGGGGSSGVTSTTTGSTGSIGGASITVTPRPANDAALDPDAACSGEVHEGQRVPLDMYFLVDQSGSMGEMVQGGSKWRVVSDSLAGFLNDPANADIATGIGYFPLTPPTTCMVGQTGCICIPFINICFPNAGGSCNVPDYAMPSIPLSLPPNHAPVVANLAMHGPGGGTPTRPALEGAMQYVNTWAQANAGRKTVAVLATDGEPSGCPTNSPQDVANIAAAALAGPSHIQTFVIGVGSALTSLNLIAQAGGTGQAFLVDTGGSVAQAFTAALNQIRGQAASCDFNIPAQTSQGPVDPLKVNVFYTPKGATQRVPILMTANSNPAACAASGGWYYDDPAAPKVIKLCDATCQSLNGGSVEVEFGCETMVITVQ